jgi:hypothetical protein
MHHRHYNQNRNRYTNTNKNEINHIPIFLGLYIKYDKKDIIYIVFKS